MKNIKYILFTVLFLFINVFYVQASCTSEEIANLKDEARKIKITYKHLGKVEIDEEIFYNQFDITVRNLNDDFYVSLLAGSEKLFSQDGVANIQLSSGKWLFKIYSIKCGMLVDEIDVFLPTFNIYSLDPLCDGVDGDEFPLCGKYYEYSINYEEFKNRVENYKKSLEVDASEDKNNFIIVGVSNLVNYVFNFVVKYKYYFLCGLFALLLIIILLIAIKRNKKRGVLE